MSNFRFGVAVTILTVATLASLVGTIKIVKSDRDRSRFFEEAAKDLDKEYP